MGADRSYLLRRKPLPTSPRGRRRNLSRPPQRGGDAMRGGV